jgi:hypothetical protein
MRDRMWNGQEHWFFRPAEPGIERSFRKLNFVVFILLAFLVAGMAVAALRPSVPTAPMSHAAPAGSKAVLRSNG